MAHWQSCGGVPPRTSDKGLEEGGAWTWVCVRGWHILEEAQPLFCVLG